ncbi:MAG: hypothetical protein VXZ72_02905 [Chlamydiota bacterium]|nr:hypothetical protein [Chlamydiota bacterium]
MHYLLILLIVAGCYHEPLKGIMLPIQAIEGAPRFVRGVARPSSDEECLLVHWQAPNGSSPSVLRCDARYSDGQVIDYSFPLTTKRGSALFFLPRIAGTTMATYRLFILNKEGESISEWQHVLWRDPLEMSVHDGLP